MPNQDLINEFQQAIIEEYGKDVGSIEAGLILRDLVGYFDKLAEIYYRMLNDKDVIIEINKTNHEK
ncbi:MAG: hypothetical protein NTU76_03740 [Candidatus Taylorbacteria bacterium]|nr:hypothetical protein [Candidatus Taylorbacteria bacterium]